MPRQYRSTTSRMARSSRSCWRSLTVPQLGSRGEGESAEVGDDLLAHQLDRLHHRVVGHLVGVDEAQEQVNPRRLVLPARVQALIRGPQHAGVVADEVVEREV